MSIETPKANEIKRLTTPLTFKDFKAYDSNGKLLKCSETLSDVRFIVEPKENLLNDNEILQFAPESKSASKIRLNRGIGDFQDVLLIHESLPWILGLFYVILICIAMPITFSKNIVGMYFVLVLFILPLLYLYYIFNLKKYAINNRKEISQEKKTKVETQPNQNTVQNNNENGIEFYKLTNYLL